MTTPYHISPEMSALIRAIYEGPLQDKPWKHFLTLLKAALQGENISLKVLCAESAGRELLVESGLSLANAASCDNWMALDPFLNQRGSGALTLDQLVPEQTLLDSQYYQKFLKPAGIRYILGNNITLGDNKELQLRVTRPESACDFSRGDQQLLDSLDEHFRLAVRYLDHLSITHIERNVFADTMNQLMIGTIILDKDSRITATNRIARETLAKVAEISTENGIFELRDPRLRREFRQMLSALSEQGVDDRAGLPQTLNLTRRDLPPLGLMLRPIRSADRQAYPLQSCAAVFFSNPSERLEISSTMLMELFNFTASEARLAALLANGLTIAEISTELDISANTTKSHIKAIYEKTGVNRQTKLIQLIYKTVAHVSA